MHFVCTLPVKCILQYALYMHFTGKVHTKCTCDFESSRNFVRSTDVILCEIMSSLRTFGQILRRKYIFLRMPAHELSSGPSGNHSETAMRSHTTAHDRQSRICLNQRMSSCTSYQTNIYQSVSLLNNSP